MGLHAPLYLAVMSGPMIGAVYRVRGRASIGSSAACDIRVLGNGVARHEGDVRPVPGALQLVLQRGRLDLLRPHRVFWLGSVELRVMTEARIRAWALITRPVPASLGSGSAVES